MNTGGGLTPEREGWAPGQAKDTMEGKCSIGHGRAGELGGRSSPLPKGYPHVWPSEMTGPGGQRGPGGPRGPGRPRGPGGPSDPRGPRHSLWRGGACLMAGNCPDHENSPDP